MASLLLRHASSPRKSKSRGTSSSFNLDAPESLPASLPPPVWTSLTCSLPCPMSLPSSHSPSKVGERHLHLTMFKIFPQLPSASGGNLHSLTGIFCPLRLTPCPLRLPLLPLPHQGFSPPGRLPSQACHLISTCFKIQTEVPSSEESEPPPWQPCPPEAVPISNTALILDPKYICLPPPPDSERPSAK